MADTPEPTQAEAPTAPADSSPPPAGIETEYRAGRPFAFTDVDKLAKAIKEYFDLQDPHTEKRMAQTGKNSKGEAMYGTREMLTEQQPYTVTGLARHLGVDRRTLLNYKQYQHYSDDIDEATKQDLIRTIADAYQRVEEYNEIGLHHPGKANGIKFNLVNNFDWQDKTISENRPAKDDLDELDQTVDARDEIAAAAAAELAATDSQPPPPAAEQPQTEPESPNDPPGPPPTE